MDGHGQGFRENGIVELAGGPELIGLGDDGFQPDRMAGAAEFIEEEIQIGAVKTVHDQHLIRKGLGCRSRAGRKAGEKIPDAAMLTVRSDINHGEIEPKGENLQLGAFGGILDVKKQKFGQGYHLIIFWTDAALIKRDALWAPGAQSRSLGNQ